MKKYHLCDLILPRETSAKHLAEILSKAPEGAVVLEARQLNATCFSITLEHESFIPRFALEAIRTVIVLEGSGETVEPAWPISGAQSNV